MAVANDKPFKSGQTVNVVRADHGWYDGRATAVITGVYKRNTGTYYYTASGLGEYDGYDFDIRHTRDAYLSG